MKNKPPIFVVGVPRSGTTLLAAMLAAHTQLSCGTETRFFRFLAGADVRKLCCPATWPHQAVDFLFAMRLVDIPIPDHFDMRREQIEGYLKQQAPAVPAMLGALTDQLRVREGKVRWVEKSPEHLLYVHAIRRYFPDAPIIRIVRDPRDVALSLMKTPWAARDFLNNLMLWHRYDEQSALFFQRDHCCYTLYYEQLVQAPEAELRRLCAFIDEEYEPQMLDTSRSAASVVTNKDRWHRIVHKPADRSRSQVWQRELAKDEQRLAEALLGDRLLAYGYSCTERFARSATVFPSRYALLKHQDALRALVADSTRFWQVAHEQQQLLVYVGEPDRDRWLRRGKWARFTGALHISRQILKSKLARRRIYWVRNHLGKVKRSFLGQVLALLFRCTAECRTAPNGTGTIA